MHMFFVDQEKLDGVLDVVVMQKYIKMTDKRGGFLMGIPKRLGCMSGQIWMILRYRQFRNSPHTQRHVEFHTYSRIDTIILYRMCTESLHFRNSYTLCV